MKRRIIDVSHWQGNIDFNRVKASGVDGVIIKAGGTQEGIAYEDGMFQSNYSKAVAAGLDVGTYYFFQCSGVNHAKTQAKHFLKLIEGLKLTLPVYCDAETFTRDKKEDTASVAVFTQMLEDAGYFAGVYASAVWGFKEHLCADWLSSFSHWSADYSSANRHPAAMWQFTSSGRVDGINGNVDLNKTDIDFAKIIRENHLNML